MWSLDFIRSVYQSVHFYQDRFDVYAENWHTSNKKQKSQYDGWFWAWWLLALVLLMVFWRVYAAVWLGVLLIHSRISCADGDSGKFTQSQQPVAAGFSNCLWRTWGLLEEPDYINQITHFMTLYICCQMCMFTTEEYTAFPMVYIW